MINAEIITIGEELLIGQVIDTNSAWISSELNLIGISVKQITSISDDKEQIIDTLNQAAKRAQLILITGGLGPTKDDITKYTLAHYFGSQLVFNESAYKNIEALFARRNLSVTELNRQQAFLPDNCTIIPNAEGTACGMWFEKDKNIFISMPGVPYEMKSMMKNTVFSLLQTHFNLEHVVHKTILTQGIGESFLAEKIEHWEDNLPAHIKLAYLPSPGIVRLRLSAKGKKQTSLAIEFEEQIKKLKEIINPYIYGYDETTLEEVIGNLLKTKKQSICTAESCTGGYIAHLITSIAGSSAYYKGSIIAYDNAVKIAQLGVNEEDLKNHGAVSKQVVEKMAQGAKDCLHTDYAIASSGIAGPDGGSDEKPVGTVWIAIAGPHGITSKVFYLGEHRGRNIQKAAVIALNMLRKYILKEEA
jgi:nicotinamide-nucleotide amidase